MKALLPDEPEEDVSSVNIDEVASAESDTETASESDQDSTEE